VTKPFAVGRSPGCQYVLADETVSSRHAELSMAADGRLFVVDCASRNGTHLVAGGRKKKIGQGLAAAADTVVFGSCAVPAADLLPLVKAFEEAQRAAADVAPRAPLKYVRCACGTVRAEGVVCPNCGAHTRGR
jgi:pSer/pThr/pTyr-binding forkhead associated (FHA) protein